MQLFYNPDIDKHTRELRFNKEESRHIIRVLRKKEDDILYITNGNDILFTAVIKIADEKKCLVEIIRSEIKAKPHNYYLHIAIAPTKMNDRYEWFLEKATEIGIDEITPLICENSERKVIKHERMQKVIISAAKQSLKFRIPKFNVPVSFSNFIKQAQDGLKFIAHCEDDEKNTLKEVIIPGQKITVLIGPEGDFSPKEIKAALQHQYIPLSLGQSRLRTETSGVFVCSAISVINS